MIPWISGRNLENAATGYNHRITASYHSPEFSCRNRPVRFQPGIGVYIAHSPRFVSVDLPSVRHLDHPNIELNFEVRYMPAFR
jgi:hypothetical protein